MMRPSARRSLGDVQAACRIACIPGSAISREIPADQAALDESDRVLRTLAAELRLHQLKVARHHGGLDEPKRGVVGRGPADGGVVAIGRGHGRCCGMAVLVVQQGAFPLQRGVLTLQPPMRLDEHIEAVLEERPRVRVLRDGGRVLPEIGRFKHEPREPRRGALRRPSEAGPRAPAHVVAIAMAGRRCGRHQGRTVPRGVIDRRGVT
ncbi:hypothetical protein CAUPRSCDRAFT_12686 [Caulochytrium protostelioides]|uniref:Uncharacterized protein n=1 Tax=Caulochytrium protostelioides TaxID=1555241 RepID=A0A4P9WR99_9FUNG|nr:hypothetical protein CAUPRSCDRAFT_12686 [Caulochytrium protostelioides]